MEQKTHTSIMCLILENLNTPAYSNLCADLLLNASFKTESHNSQNAKSFISYVYSEEIVIYMYEKLKGLMMFLFTLMPLEKCQLLAKYTILQTVFQSKQRLWTLCYKRCLRLLDRIS